MAWTEAYREKYARTPEDRATYYQANKAQVDAANKAWVGANRNKARRYCREYRSRNRAVVYAHYSNGTNACVTCGFSNPDALTLDHTNNDGAEHRRRIGPNPSTLHLLLIKEGFPAGFQVLCHNCQWIKENARRREKYSSPS